MDPGDEARQDLDGIDSSAGQDARESPYGIGSLSSAHTDEPSTHEDQAGETMPSFLRDEVAPILAAAERAATQIVDRAREQARKEADDLEQKRREVEMRIQQLATWQEHVEPSIVSLQSKVADIQSKIDEVPELIRRALDPVASAISSLGSPHRVHGLSLLAASRFAGPFAG